MKPAIVVFAIIDGVVLLGLVGSLIYDQLVPYRCAPASPPLGSHLFPAPCISPASLLAFLLLVLLVPLLIVTFVLIAIDQARLRRQQAS